MHTPKSGLALRSFRLTNLRFSESVEFRRPTRERQRVREHTPTKRLFSLSLFLLKIDFLLQMRGESYIFFVRLHKVVMAWVFCCACIDCAWQTLCRAIKASQAMSVERPFPPNLRLIFFGGPLINPHRVLKKEAYCPYLRSHIIRCRVHAASCSPIVVTISAKTPLESCACTGLGVRRKKTFIHLKQASSTRTCSFGGENLGSSKHRSPVYERTGAMNQFSCRGLRLRHWSKQKV
jgi:hypothetical protein